MERLHTTHVIYRMKLYTCIHTCSGGGEHLVKTQRIEISRGLCTSGLRTGITGKQMKTRVSPDPAGTIVPAVERVGHLVRPQTELDREIRFPSADE